MTKEKKTCKHRSSSDESPSEDSDDAAENIEASKRHKHKKVKRKKASKYKSKKNRSKRHSEHEHSDSRSPASANITSSSESADEQRRESKRHERPYRKTTEQSSQSHRRKRSREPEEEQSSGGEPNVSKWDSPERRAARQQQRSRSRSRQRHRYNNERGQSTEGAETQGLRMGRVRGYGTRNDYAERNNYRESRDYQERSATNRNQRGVERWRDTEDRGNERRQRSRSRSPRYARPYSTTGNERFKREPRDHNRSPNRRERDGGGGGGGPPPHRRRSRDRDNKSNNYEWGGKRAADKSNLAAAPGSKDAEPVEKEKPNFGLSGALLEDTNKVNGVIVKYSEPPEARKPKRRWRLYPFKGETALPTLHIHRQSCFLVGRDRKVVDLAVDHPSCSKQHAALQYRLVPFERDDGTQGKRVRLYLIDLESANGTFLNNKKIDARKYYELMEKDVIKFGFSTREYVLLHENSKEDQEDDDVMVKAEPEDIPDGPNP